MTPALVFALALMSPAFNGADLVGWFAVILTIAYYFRVIPTIEIRREHV